MVAKISVSTARGNITAPPSKSMAHRLLISAALAKGESKIYNVALSRDIIATIMCLTSIGARIEIYDDFITVQGINIANIKTTVKANCIESGSTLRFIIPIMLLLGIECEITGSEYLLTRPLSIYEKIADEQGFKFKKLADKIELCGKLESGEYAIEGNISSQFISGLLFALPLLKGDSTIKIIGKLESRPYVDLTIDALKEFGVVAEFLNDNEIFIKGSQEYKISNVTVEGDYSNAAFLEALNCLGCEVNICGLKEDSKQGDKAYIEYFKLLKSSAPQIDISDCPDLAPILFTLASYFNGATFTGTKRLKIKESDRAETMKTELKKFGADIQVFENSVVINKSVLHKPKCDLFGHNDHRVVMSLAVLLSLFGGKILGAEAVSKSFPDFFEKISSLGIGVNLIED